MHRIEQVSGTSDAQLLCARSTGTSRPQGGTGFKKGPPHHHYHHICDGARNPIHIWQGIDPCNHFQGSSSSEGSSAHEPLAIATPL